MRHATPAEIQTWRALADAHGFLDPSGRVELGRVGVERIDGQLWARVITPLRANPYTDDLKEKVPPIRFDRRLDGRLRIPGRWWVDLFERISQQEVFEAGVRALAARIAHEASLPTTLLPATTDTIVITADGPQGRRIEFEALPPGTMLPIPLVIDAAEDTPPAA
jgi:hypothetical protein